MLVTRPSPQGERLCDQIRSNGGKAIHFPTIVFAPPRDISAYQAAIDQIGEQSWLIFNSPQAVSAAVPDLRRRWPLLPASVRFAAVGSGTAKALRTAGYLAAVWPEESWNSEGLLDLPDFQSVRGVKIAVIRGEGGREKIDSELAFRGALVLPVIAYRRELPVVSAAGIDRLTVWGKPDVIVCTSGEAVQNLKQLLGARGFELIKNALMIVMSNRVKLLAEESGFGRVCVTPAASDEAVLQVLERIR